MEWINVENRLPDADGHFIIFCPWMEVADSALFDSMNKQWLTVYQSHNAKRTRLTNVTHWSTFPELPGETPNNKQAKKFSDWIVRNNYQGKDTIDEGVIYNIPGNTTCYTTTELFDIFLTQNKD